MTTLWTMIQMMNRANDGPPLRMKPQNALIGDVADGVWSCDPDAATTLSRLVVLALRLRDSCWAAARRWQ